MPEVSIIVPVYNVEKYIHRCVDSILTQTFTDFECILIDDGSSDNSPAICDEYTQKDSRIKVIHQINGGVSSARNVGLDVATGEWIGFVDSDDWVEPTYLEELYKEAERSDADIIICGYKEYIGNRFVVHTCNYSILTKEDFFTNFAFFRNNQNLTYILHSPISKFYKKVKLLENNIFFDEYISLGEDYLFNLKYLLTCEYITIKPYASYNYNRKDNSLSDILSLNNKKIENLLFIADYTIFYVNNNVYIKNKKQSYEKYFYTTICLVINYGLNNILNDNKLYFSIRNKISVINVIFNKRIKTRIKIPLILFKFNYFFLLKNLILLENKLKRIIV